MADYQPPRENVPIFDTTLFGRRGLNIEGGGGGGGGLTEAEMDELYVKWPISQATGETFNNSTTITNTLSVAGTAGFQSTLSVAQDLTLGQDILMTNVGSYIRFPDTTQQTIAFKPLTPNPQGVYLNANISVNAYGQVTTGSSNPNALISRVVLTPATLLIGNVYPIVCPAGTKIVEVILCSGGGLQGTNALDTGTDTMYAGGSGASGCCAICSFEMSPPPYTIGTNNYLGAAFINPTLPGQGVGVGVGWSAAAAAYFGNFLPISLTSQSICILGGGIAGGNASIGTPGAGGNNASFANQVSLADQNNTLSTVYAQGQNGSSLPPIPSFTTCPFTPQPAPTCPLADFNPISSILEPLITGGYSEYSGGSITAFAQGTGGIVISYFT